MSSTTRPLSAPSSAPTDGSAPTRLRDGTRVEVLAGNPGPEELAAVVAALEQAGAADTGRRRAEARPRWRRAARQEAVGGGPVVSPGALGRTP